MDGFSMAGGAAALWASLNILLLLTLSGLVVRQRRRHRIPVGDGDVPELRRALRAFGNASEYIPTGIGALAILTVAGASATVVHVIGALLFFGRVAHGIGFTRSTGVSIGRSVGMVLTWLALLISAVSLLAYSV